MEKEIRIYDLHDPKQYEDEKMYRETQTPQERLHTLEVIRKTGNQLLDSQENNNDGNQQRLRRVLRTVERS